MRIMYWAASLVDGTALYRLRIPALALQQRGHQVRISTDILANQELADWVHDQAQIIVGQRVMNPKTSILWREMCASGKWTMVFELDDDLLSIDPRQNELARNAADQATTWRMMQETLGFEPGSGIMSFGNAQTRSDIVANIRAAHMVQVSTEHLAAQVRPYNANVVVLPNSMPDWTIDEPLPTRRGTDHRPVVIGWQGSSTHGQDWRVMGDAITAVLREHAAAGDVRLRFLGTNHMEKLSGDVVHMTEYLPWTTDLKVHLRRVKRFDIGLGPLTDTTFNRSKSNLRALEMAALGVPGVFSDVEAYRGTVEPGVTGYLAKTPSAWREAIEGLIGLNARRRSMGDAAREAARAWTIGARVPLWEQAYASLL